MPDFPQDIVDEMSPATAGVKSTPTDEASPLVEDSEESGEYKPQPKQAGAVILSPEQQVVMHKLSQAIAMIVYGPETNKPLRDMASQGSLGVVKAVQAVMEKVSKAAKPGIPRELIPMAAFACLVMIQDFLERMDHPGINMKVVVPALIDALSRQFNATRAEKIGMTRLKRKFLNKKQAAPGPVGKELPEPGAEEDVPQEGQPKEPPVDDVEGEAPEPMELDEAKEPQPLRRTRKKE